MRKNKNMKSIDILIYIMTIIYFVYNAITLKTFNRVEPKA